MIFNQILSIVALVLLALYFYTLLSHRRDELRLINKLQERRQWLLVGEGGIYKRIDELREDVALIARAAPEIFSKFPWVYSHLENCDSFLNEIASLSNVKPGECYIKSEPRSFPAEQEIKASLEETKEFFSGQNAFWKTEAGKKELAERVNKEWYDAAYPLKLLTLKAQGSKNTSKESLVSQLKIAIEHIETGAILGSAHDDDFGFAFQYKDESYGTIFSGPAGLSIS